MQPIETAWNQLIELVNQVQEAGGLSQAGSDGWTVKDHLVHIAAWEHSLLALIQGQDRERAMGLLEGAEGIDNENEAVRKLHQHGQRIVKVEDPDGGVGYGDLQSIISGPIPEIGLTADGAIT